MNSLFIDCSTGVAGDMLTSALLDLTNNKQKQLFLKKSNNLLSCAKTKYRSIQKSGIEGITIDVIIDQNQGEYSEDVKNTSVSALTKKDQDIIDINPYELINNFELSTKCKDNITKVFDLLMKTESFVHHTSSKHSIHFNRIGSIDALIDISNICILLEILNIDSISCTPINTGTGQVKYNNHIFDVPAPATKKLLEDIPNYHNEIYGELCTPTGVAVLKYFTNNFSRKVFTNDFKQIGIGFGQKDFSQPTFVKSILL